MKPLNKEQVAMYKAKMINGGSPVRFMHEGCAVSITTGEHDPKGTNVMHQRMYWCFDKETALEIAAITGTRAQF